MIPNRDGIPDIPPEDSGGMPKGIMDAIGQQLEQAAREAFAHVEQPCMWCSQPFQNPKIRSARPLCPNCVMRSTLMAIRDGRPDVALIFCLMEHIGANKTADFVQGKKAQLVKVTCSRCSKETEVIASLPTNYCKECMAVLYSDAGITHNADDTQSYPERDTTHKLLWDQVFPQYLASMFRCDSLEVPS